MSSRYVWTALPPQQREAKPDWSCVPESLIRQLETLLRAGVCGAETAWGGYSPSASYIVTLSGDKKVFVKGTHPEQDAHGAQILRQETAAYQALPVLAEIASPYLGCVATGGEDGWLLGVWDHIPRGVPVLPWTEEKLCAVFAQLSRVHTLKRPEVPEHIRRAQDTNFVEGFFGDRGWVALAEQPHRVDGFLSLFDDKAAAQDWLNKSFPVLLEAQKNAGLAAGPCGVINFDIRSDNILFDTEGTAHIVDWPDACWGPVALDLAVFLPGVAGEGGPAPDRALKLYEKVTGLKPAQKDLAAALANVSGYLALNAWRPVPEKLPRLRWVQKQQLQAGLVWTETLLDLPPAPALKAG